MRVDADSMLSTLPSSAAPTEIGIELMLSVAESMASLIALRAALDKSSRI